MDSVPNSSLISSTGAPNNIKPNLGRILASLKNFVFARKKIFIPVSIVLILILALFSLRTITKKGAILPSEKWDKLILDQKYTPLYILSPSQSSKYGIASHETFTLKTKDSQDVSIIQNNLVSSKPVKITKNSNTEFKIVPTGDLNIGETISFSIKNDKDYSWIFQTAPKFNVVQSLPTNEARNVPINAGIEIKFNNDNYNLINSDVEIQPKIDFRIEKHDEKASIVPINPLQPMTVYTVTVKKGFSLFSSNNALSEDYSFSFQTSDEKTNKGRISLEKDFQEIFPDEHLITKVYANKFDSNQVINAQVYKFPSADKFLSSRANLDKINSSWMRYYGEQDMIDTKSLARVAAADVKLQEKDGLQYLELPQNLDEGMYLVQFWFDGYKKVEQLWVQSSPIVGYVSVGKLQTVVWVNSSKNEPLDSSTISIIGNGNTYLTNNEGWATFPTPASLFESNIKNYLSVTTSGGRNLILPIGSLANHAKPDDIVADDYWSYIYHERLLYKPNDTIYFWGVAKNRDSGTPPSNIDIYIGDTLNQSVVPQFDGSFIGKVQLIDAPVGYESISAKVGEVTLSQSYFQISDYVKPELKIEVEGNKKAIFAGESVDYKAKVSFFDGTPTSNLNLYLSAHYGSLDKTQASANSNGDITFKYQSKFDTPNSYPRYEGVNVSAIKSGDEPSDGSVSVYVYGSRFQIDTVSTQKGNQAKLEATVSNLDLSRINDKGLSNPVSGPAGNQKVSLITTKIWHEKKQTGTYYDFVEKVTRPSYTYTRHDNVIEQKDLYTNANGNVTYNFSLEPNNSYQVKLSVVDGQGNLTEDSNYFYYSDYQNNSGQSPKAYLNLDRDTNLFGLGDEVDIKIQKNGSDYQKTDASKFLFIIANRGRQDVYILSSPELKFNFEQKDIPEVYVGSIIFNGKYYEEVNVNCKNGWSCEGYGYYYYNENYYFNPLLIQYQKDNSKLGVTIATDKTKYQPGDKANVTIKVTKNENPISGASVQLTVVDEALAAIGGVKEPSILTSLYKQVSNLIYYNYYSHKPVLPNSPQAEQGGGGGRRDLFKDTAFFDTSTTDSNGIATFTISLPDNITNWLTYAQVISENIDAGQAKSSIVATKDFFMTSQFPNTITTKDSPLVAISAFGNALNESSQIPTEVSFDKDTQELAKNSLITTAFKENYIEFPKLTIGKYRVTVKGSHQNYEDGITLPLNVISSRLDFNMTTNKVLQKGDILKSFDNINPETSKPIKLLVADEGKGKYYYDLLSYCYQNSNRLEKRVASIKADEIITSRFKNTTCSGYNADLSNFQNSDGGLKQIEWGGSDLETTIWAIYVNPTAFNKEKLITYLENYNAYSTQQDKILQNWGLTMLGIPKINELNQLSQLANTYKEKILSALALYSAGNTEKSKEIYMNILSEYAYTNKPYLRIQADPKKSDYNTYALDTSYALLLGTINSISDYSNGFNLYLRDYSGNVSAVVLDISNISYIDKILSDLPDKDTTIAFKSDSQNLTKNITKNGFLSIDLKPSEVNNFSLSVTDGKADAVLSYYITPDNFSKLQSDNRVSLTKTVKKVKGSVGDNIKIGDILEVNLRYDFDNKAPLGCYTLTDEIPSGMTYLDNLNNYDLSISQKGRLYPEKANIVKGYASNSICWKQYTDNTSVYFVRVTAAGKFVQEPAIIQSSTDPSIFQKTSEEYVTVSR